MWKFVVCIILSALVVADCHVGAEKTLPFTSMTGPPSSSDITTAMVERFLNLWGEARVLPGGGPARRGRMAYLDGSGTYVGSDEVQHYASGVKCWSDYFVVETGRWYGPWTKASGNVYCTGTSECSIAHMDGHTTCETWSVDVSSGIEADWISFEVSLGYSHQNCNTGTDTSQCTWSDQACHCIWTQQEMSYQNGYKRRRCSSSNGDYTAWMQNIVHDAPTNRVSYGCGSKCTD